MLGGAAYRPPSCRARIREGTRGTKGTLAWSAHCGPLVTGDWAVARILDAEVEIGYRLRRSAWGQGYATEAAQEVRDYAFHTLGMKRLIAIIDPANVASIRVAEKIGMNYEQDVMFEGYTHPDHVYVVTSGSFKK